MEKVLEIKKSKTKFKTSVFTGVIILMLGILGFSYLYNNFYLPKSEVYLVKVQIKDKQKATEPGLSTYISKKLGTFIDKPLENTFETNLTLYFDTTKYKHPGDDFEYIELYLIPENNIYPKYKQTSDEYATVKVVPLDSNIKPYLEKPTYCTSNSDCSIRDNICRNGAYNKYQWLLDIYGCEAPSGEYDEAKNCYREVTYSNPRCESNICVANKTIGNKCEESI